jgi:hypothetical protein
VAQHRDCTVQLRAEGTDSAVGSSLQSPESDILAGLPSSPKAAGTAPAPATCQYRKEPNRPH